MRISVFLNKILRIFFIETLFAWIQIRIVFAWIRTIKFCLDPVPGPEHCSLG